MHSRQWEESLDSSEWRKQGFNQILDKTLHCTFVWCLSNEKWVKTAQSFPAQKEKFGKELVSICCIVNHQGEGKKKNMNNYGLLLELFVRMNRPHRSAVNFSVIWEGVKSKEMEALPLWCWCHHTGRRQHCRKCQWRSLGWILPSWGAWWDPRETNSLLQSQRVAVLQYSVSCEIYLILCKPLLLSPTVLSPYFHNFVLYWDIAFVILHPFLSNYGADAIISWLWIDVL